MADDLMTTDEAITEIRRILDQHVPGTWNNGIKMARFLKQVAQEESDSVNDDMSSRTE